MLKVKKIKRMRKTSYRKKIKGWWNHKKIIFKNYSNKIDNN
jgi:hypothetical protein